MPGFMNAYMWILKESQNLEADGIKLARLQGREWKKHFQNFIAWNFSQQQISLRKDYIFISKPDLIVSLSSSD